MLPLDGNIFVRIKFVFMLSYGTHGLALHGSNFVNPAVSSQTNQLKSQCGCCMYMGTPEPTNHFDCAKRNGKGHYYC